MPKENPVIWRRELRDLTDEELLDELQRPQESWREMVREEALFRLLKKSKL